MGHMKPNSAEPLDAEDQARRRRRAAASSDDDRLAAFARDLSDSWYSDLPPKLDAGGVSTSNANKKSTFIRLFSHRRRRRAAASSDDDRLAAFARDLSDSWYSDLPPKLDAGGVSTSNANKKSTFIRLFSHRVKRTTPRGRPANSNERSEGHTSPTAALAPPAAPLPALLATPIHGPSISTVLLPTCRCRRLSQHNGVPVLRCRIEKRLVQRTDGCGPRDEPPPHTELRRADVKVELAAACSVPSTASTGSPAICGQKRRRFWDQGVRARRCP
ncbi:hypothetical protein FJT64_025799 [Amphibalanus amphitrite]|uniref:Uncharacterized protein n=1 Tax=Amphibalanus amphitrite TaxID=1232801 RepID=A0A6A4W6M6_AMPAM|nr:hypothetical protein FJT64_025799 [Amphibalanus amphitrite]